MEPETLDYELKPLSRSEEHTSELQSRVDISYAEIYTLSLHDALPI